MTDVSPEPKPRRAARAALSPAPASGPSPAPAAPAQAPARPSRPARARRAAAPATEPSHRHPNLGLPPLDLTAGFPAAAAALRRNRSAIAAAALQAVVAHEPEFADRFDQVGLRQLLADAEVLIDRLAISVASNDPRPMAEYAEWIDPIFRRRRVSLWDLAALCAAIRDTAAPRLDEAAAASLTRALNAAIEVLRKNGRLGGDTHKRDALLQWLYRGV